MSDASGITPAQWRTLIAQVDAILLAKWDPIGIADIPEAYDEYSSYAPRLAAAAVGGDVDGVAKLLGLIQSEQMGIQPSMKHDRVIASQLVDLATAFKRES